MIDQIYKAVPLGGDLGRKLMKAVACCIVFGLLLRLAVSFAGAQATPTAVLDAIYPYTIAGLQARSYPGGTINSRYVLEEADSFTRVYIDYPSDGLTITGVMNIPHGAGPFPVIILLHGYYDRAGYWSGLGTWQEAEFFARQGYLTIAPDFRSWGESDPGINLFATGLVIDTLNLISSLPTLPQADPARVGVWGHSMGGGVATKTLLIDERIQAGVLYAPNSADDTDLITRWGAACLPGQSETTGDHCNPAEVLSDAPPELVQEYFEAAASTERMEAIAPIYHLDALTTPVQIHIGTADGELLTQTPPEWSERLYKALVEAKADVRYFVYPDQGHFFSGPAWTQMVQRALTFYNEQLAAGAGG
jgi:uncharacterized protein